MNLIKFHYEGREGRHGNLIKYDEDGKNKNYYDKKFLTLLITEIFTIILLLVVLSILITSPILNSPVQDILNTVIQKH